MNRCHATVSYPGVKLLHHMEVRTIVEFDIVFHLNPAMPIRYFKTKEEREGAGKRNAGKSAAQDKPVFWSYLALHEQQRVIANLPSNATKKVVAKPAEPQVPVATGTITVGASGVINIPASACSHPTRSTQAAYRSGLRDLVTFLKNASGDTYLRLSRFATGNDSFEYTFTAPTAGTYQLTAKVATPHWDQVLQVSANGGEPAAFALPYTKGLWDTTGPMKIQLKNGENVIKFHGPARVVAHHFTLSPLK